MRNLILTISLILIGFVGLGQSNKLEDHVKQGYDIDTIKTTVGESIINLLLVDGKTELEGTRIWLLQEQTDSVIHHAFLGQASSEYGFYIPVSQPLKDSFIIVECDEYNGTIHLINSYGNWAKIPGYYYAVEDEHIFTKAAGDGRLTVAKYDIKNDVLEKKNWSNAKGNPWNIKKEYNYQDIKWLKIR